MTKLIQKAKDNLSAEREARIVSYVEGVLKEMEAEDAKIDAAGKRIAELKAKLDRVEAEDYGDVFKPGWVEFKFNQSGATTGSANYPDSAPLYPLIRQNY